MADDIVTDNAALSQQLNVLREQVRTSYGQSGVSEQTRRLLSQYVDTVARTSLDVSASTPSERDLVEDIASSLELQVSDPAIFNAIERQIADIAGGKHVAGGSPSQRLVEKKADPVEMFSGQFTHQAADVMIDGAGMDFVFQRTYKSQVVFNGPLGANWDHLYNLYVRERGTDLLRSSGDLREDTYTRHPLFGQGGFDYWCLPTAATA